MGSAELLSVELKLFERHRDEWLRSHLGQFVAIRDDVIVGFFGTYAEAFRAGLQQFGVSRSFLIKQIWKTEPVYLVS